MRVGNLLNFIPFWLCQPYAQLINEILPIFFWVALKKTVSQAIKISTDKYLKPTEIPEKNMNF